MIDVDTHIVLHIDELSRRFIDDLNVDVKEPAVCLGHVLGVRETRRLVSRRPYRHFSNWKALCCK